MISRQLRCPENSRSERITITRAVMPPGATNPPPRHATPEPVWIARRGHGPLLVEGGERVPFAEGDVARFADNDLHGFANTSASELEYISVTSPPVTVRAACAKDGVSVGNTGKA